MCRIKMKAINITENKSFPVCSMDYEYRVIKTCGYDPESTMIHIFLVEP